MGSILCNLHYLRVNRFGSIRVANNVLSRNHLKPGAGSSISPVSNLQMITVTAECIAQATATSVLNSCSGGYDDRYVLFLSRFVIRKYDIFIHGFLVFPVSEKSGVVGVFCISPSLLHGVFYIRIGCIRLDVFHEFCQFGEIRTVLSGERACLLKYNVVPFLVFQGFQ